MLDDTLHPVGTALAAGHIDAGKAAIFTDLLATQEPAVCFAVTDQVLPAAPGLPHHALKKRIQAVLIQTDPTTAHHRALQAATRRRVEHPRLLPDGQACLRVIAPALDIAAIYTAAEAAAKAARAAGDPRTLDQLRADALTTLATTALNNGTLTSVPGCHTLLTTDGTTATSTSTSTGTGTGTGTSAGIGSRTGSGTAIVGVGVGVGDATIRSGPGTNPVTSFEDLIELAKREHHAAENDPSPLCQVRRTLDAAIEAVSARTRQRLGHPPTSTSTGTATGSQGPASIADALLHQDAESANAPTQPDGTQDLDPGNGLADPSERFRPFVPFSGTTSRLTLALAPEHLTEPDPDHIDPVHPWQDDLALTTNESQWRFETYEAPETCRTGIDVPELLGFAPLDPTTARLLAAHPPRWLTITTALADITQQADRERETQRERGGGLTRATHHPVDTTNTEPDDDATPTTPTTPTTTTTASAPGEDTSRYWPPSFNPAPHLATPNYRPGAELDRLVRALHPTCIAPACTVASTACDNDHAVEWPTGPTDAPNLRPLCRHHHRLKTHHGHSYRIAPDGSTIWTTPTGHTYHRPPAGDTHLIGTPQRRTARKAG
ncbi:HNH endonuclease signature motif containing protein [Serinibacter arcticus]|uniref:HNH endonuclease signature motif containing protein n=1 Tax=Serinibacter arcticus TaxID=1655435 RepID=UPI002E26D495